VDERELSFARSRVHVLLRNLPESVQAQAKARKAGATSNAGSNTSFQTLDQSPPFAASSISWMAASMSKTNAKKNGLKKQTTLSNHAKNNQPETIRRWQTLRG
jgi:hypothetical protein